MNTKVKRIFAFCLDALIFFSPQLILGILSNAFESDFLRLSSALATVSKLVEFPALCLFVVRDSLFKDASPAKKLLGLQVLDDKSFEPANKMQLILNNVVCFFWYIDFFLLLRTNSTLGNRISHTVTVQHSETDMLRTERASSQAYDFTPPAEQYPYNAPFQTAQNKSYDYSRYGEKRHKRYPQENKTDTAALKKTLVIVFTAIFVTTGVIIAAVFGIVSYTLNKEKQSEEYALAYSYLVSHSEFQRMHLDEDDIRLNSVRKQSGNNLVHKNVSKTVEYEFHADGYVFTIVCHEKNGQWRVCKSCSLF